MQCPVAHLIIFFISIPAGSVVVVDSNFKRLLVLRPNSRETDEWYPGYAACDNAGKFYVCDTNQDQILVFNRSGNQVMSYSTEADQLLMPLCLLIDKKDTMFVSGKNKVCQYKIRRRKSLKWRGWNSLPSSAGLTISLGSMIWARPFVILRGGLVFFCLVFFKIIWSIVRWKKVSWKIHDPAPFTEKLFLDANNIPLEQNSQVSSPLP